MSLSLRVLLAGRFSAITLEEATEQLEALDIEVVSSLQQSPDVLFAGIRPGQVLKKAEAQKLPICDESTLQRWLLTSTPPDTLLEALGILQDDGQTFLESLEIGPYASEEALMDAFSQADWSTFSPKHDLAALRRVCLHLEARVGIRPVHHLCTEQLRAYGLYLTHSFGHESDIVTSALSPDGHFLVTGSRHRDDATHGGVLQLWDIYAARCLNTVTHIPQGVVAAKGALQWRPDGRALAVMYGHHLVSQLDPFSHSPSLTEPALLTLIQIVDKPGSPLVWTWSPDGKELCLTLHDPDEQKLPLCVVPMDEGWHFREDVSSVSAARKQHFPPKQYPLPGRLWWLSDGSALLAARRETLTEKGAVYAIHPKSGRCEWRDEVGQAVSLSPDEAYVAIEQAMPSQGFLTGRKSQLCLLETQTGESLLKMPLWGECVGLSWTLFEKRRRLAVFLKESRDASVLLLENEQLLATLPPSPYFVPDEARWAWSPEGDKAAFWTQEGLEVWSVSTTPARIWRVPHDGCEAVYWAAGEQILCVGRRDIEWWDALTGQLRHRHEVKGPRSVLGGGQKDPLSQTEPSIAERYPVHPCIPVDGQWVTAFPDGTIVCPEALHDRLDGLLHFVVGHESEEGELVGTWPRRWAASTIYPDMKSALADPFLPVSEEDRSVLLTSLKGEDE
ncbi:MAG: hypothetical protein CL920_31425 [Deltaproteobacteria bacterium]|nr:hypothetical protein [Deltaproteobacteria bacterium]|tara:strand:+ start:7858 stop:9879 length:2022 start_codon:yes stop_codon:yes gene_type:complete